MRVTTNMIRSSQTRAINQNLIKYQTVGEQLYSGKLITKPSQNPYFATKIMDYKQEISSKEQYQRNIDHTTVWLNEADSTLSDVNSVMLRIKELTTKAAGDTNSDDDLEAIANELDQLIESIADSLNKNIDGNYIFGGGSTTKPFDATQSPAYVGGSEVTKIEISKGVSIDRNIIGASVAQTTMVDKDGNLVNVDLFDSLKELSTAIRNDDKDQIAEKTKELNAHSQNILSKRTEIGAKQNRVELASERNEYEILSLKEMLSNIEDVDYAEKFIELKSIEAIYSASLQVSSSIMQQSLLNFLR